MEYAISVLHLTITYPFCKEIFIRVYPKVSKDIHDWNYEDIVTQQVMFNNSSLAEFIPQCQQIMENVKIGHNADKEMQNLANEISDLIVSEQFQLLADEISREDDNQEFNFLGEENEFHQGSTDKIISREDDSQEFNFLGEENELQQISTDKIWIEVCVQDEQHPNKN